MHIAIAGATGAVGQEMCALLEQGYLFFDQLTCLASSRSAGKTIPFKDRRLPIQELTPASFNGVDLALFALDSGPTREFVPHALEAGATIIDNSSAYRMDSNVPLVIPEVNPQDLNTEAKLIANPNCSTIIMAIALWPLHRTNPVRRVIVSTYQAASGAGTPAMDELLQQTRQIVNQPDALTSKNLHQNLTPRVLPHPYAFNLFSHNTAIDDTGYNEEERKMLQETRKIFRDSEIQVSATCVRVPILRAHTESITATFQNPFDEKEARKILSSAPGVKVVDDRLKNYFPMPSDASGQDDVLVGRIRRDHSDPSGKTLCLLVCGDQLRKGAALNAIQIAQQLLNHR